MKPFLLTLCIVVSALGARPEVFFKRNKTSSGEIGAVVEAYLRTYDIPGAVVLIGHGQGISFHQAFGAIDGQHILNKDSVFDLASITKLFTAAALLRVMEDASVSIQTPVAKALPEYRRDAVASLTFEDLLRHESGMRAVPGDQVFSSRSNPWEGILAIDPERAAGEFLYSDVNYLVLGKALESMGGKDLSSLVDEILLEPLEMNHSGFKPRAKGIDCDKLCAPVSRASGPGIVHDPSARKLGGVAGHAGMYASAKDLAKFASLFLNEGHYCGRPVISRRQVIAMTEKREGSSRGLGFDITSPYSEKPRGDYFAKGLSFGHTGYTGVSLWIDPTLDTYLIVLSNPVYAQDWKRAKKGFLQMARELATLVGKAYLY